MLKAVALPRPIVPYVWDANFRLDHLRKNLEVYNLDV